jgi:hypothetical protein
MEGLPKPENEKKYKDLQELFEDDDCCEEIKLQVLAKILRMATHNSVKKDELLAMLRWVVNENYYWETPKPKPNLRVVK